MIKFYKNITDYAEIENISTKTAGKRIKNNLVEVFEVPKGMKYYEVDKSVIIAEYINEINKRFGDLSGTKTEAIKSLGN